MIRLLRAFAWLRWRMLVNTVKGNRRRDSLERFARISALLSSVFFALLFLPTALAMAAGGLVGGWLLAGGGTPAFVTMVVLRALLALLLVVILIAPIMSSMVTPSVAVSRFLLLPIPRSLLHLTQVAASLVDPWIAIFLPGLLLLALGLLLARGIGAGLVALAAGLAVVAFFAALNALLTFLIQLMLRDRKRGEVVMLVFFTGLMFTGLIPHLIGSYEERGEQVEPSEGRRGRPTETEAPAPEGAAPDRAGEGAAAASAPAEAAAGEGTGGDEETDEPGWTPPEDLDTTFPRGLQWLPSELYTRIVVLAASRRVGSAWLPLAGLLFAGAAFYRLSWGAYRRLLASPETASGRRGAARRPVRLVRVPGLAPVAAAVAAAQARTVLRTVRGKMTLLNPALTVVFFGIMFATLTREFPTLGGVPKGILLAGMGLAMSMIAIAALLVNQFAYDGPGLTLQFLSPVSDGDLVTGKLAGGACIGGASLLLALVTGALLWPGGAPLLWLSVLLAGGAVYLVLAPITVFLAAVFPKTADLSKLGHDGNPNQAANLLAFLLASLLCLPPAVLLLIGALLEKPGLAFLLVAGWTVASAMLGRVLLVPAVGLVRRRRENLAMVAQGR